MTTSSRFIFGLVVVLLTGATTILAAAGQPGGPLEGQWFVAPLVGLITAIAGFVRQETGLEDGE